ncbi:Ldh family oxidoreductase [Falsiroseomonas sp. HW251]|uniref:Ldh family oxidoreductase n=1 Tax=Falsiroseomonas sp. HW251 TaxID=3390998 RepID=UPI003D313588
MDGPGGITVDGLRGFAAALLRAAGLEAAKAGVVAEVLAEADLLGHDTHGVALLPRYLEDLQSGVMARDGEPEVIADRGATIAWNGRRLPGCWLVSHALDIGFERVGRFGMVGIAIGNAHHMGALAAYLERATSRGLVLTMTTCAPGAATVAPFGGLRGALSPAPSAFGFPTGGDPVMVDISASITTNNMALRLAREGRRYDRPWLMDARGEPTDDPAVLQKGGTVLPAGGTDHGQKGYGWALQAEMLSQGLSGHGRADGPKGLANAAFIQVIDPGAFAGLDAFTRQADAIAASCRASPPRPGRDAVRLPGESGLRRKEAALARGIALRPETLSTLRPWAEKLSVPLPI